jgi:hypothetical protein
LGGILLCFPCSILPLKKIEGELQKKSSKELVYFPLNEKRRKSFGHPLKASHSVKKCWAFGFGITFEESRKRKKPYKQNSPSKLRCLPIDNDEKNFRSN